MLEGFIAAVHQLEGNPWAPAIFVGAYALACLCAPISLFPVAGGVLFGFWKGTTLSLLGGVLGAFLAFLLARKWAQGIVGKLLGKRMSRWQSFLGENDLATLLSIRILGFPPFIMVNYLCGLSSLRVSTYLLGTFLGLLPWTVLFVGLSHSLWAILLESGPRGFGQAVAGHARPLLLVGVVVLLFVLLQKRIQKRPKPH